MQIDFSGITIQNGKTICLREFHARALCYAHELSAQGFTPGSELLLQPTDRLSGIIQFWGMMLAGITPVLDERGLLFAQESYPVAPCYTERDSLEYESGDIPSLAAIEQNATILFVTSGSTGVAKIVRKKFRALSCETEALGDLYGLNGSSLIVLMISPFHIYGFLHGIMLTLYCGCRLLLASTFDSLVSEQEVLKIDLLVAVPSLWSLAKRMFETHQVTTLVTSGASFGELRAEEICSQNLKVQRVLEIMGSTETGGIGYRSFIRSGMSYPPFELFKTHTLTQTGENSYALTSPYLENEHRYQLQDHIAMVDERKFYHLDRLDGIFKWAGQRFSLTEVEQNLSKIIGHDNLYCYFTVDSVAIKGGRLTLVVECCGELDLEKLKEQYIARFATPYPTAFVRLERLLRDANGKFERRHILAEEGVK